MRLMHWHFPSAHRGGPEEEKRERKRAETEKRKYDREERAKIHARLIKQKPVLRYQDLQQEQERFDDGRIGSGSLVVVFYRWCTVIT